MDARIQGPLQPRTYSLEDIQQYTQPKKPSGFRRFLGAVAGGVSNVVLPGSGPAVSEMITGGMGTDTNLLGDLQQYLEVQQQIQAQARAFEMASNILKAKHDAAMAAIRNIK